MPHSVVKSGAAPAAIGPYSQAIRSGQLVFTSGQLGLSPDTGQMVEGGVEAETRQALRNLSAILQSVGADFHAVVKVTIFLADLKDFEVVNRIYAEHFVHDPPARSTVQVAALPRNGRIEIEAVASLV